MEPLEDRELDELLREWRAPAAPATLDERLRQGRRRPRWQWLFTGTVRVPVPVTVLALVAFVMMLVITFEHRAGNHTSHGEFHAVKEVQVRIIRSSYESNR